MVSKTSPWRTLSSCLGSELADDAGDRGVQHRLHFHGFDGQQGGAGDDFIPFLHLIFAQGASQGSDHGSFRFIAPLADAGISPSLASEKQKTLLSAATAKSQQQPRPRPPPYVCP